MRHPRLRRIDFKIVIRQLPAMPRHLILSTSLNPGSRSRVLAEIALKHFQQNGADVELVDISKMTLPLCDAFSCYAQPDVVALNAKITEARGIIMATAIYNYDVSAAAKNVLELTGDAWSDKIVSFLCAAGGHGSYMSVMSFANSLMLDYRCVVLPRFVYAPRVEISDKTFGDAAVNGRIEQLTVEMVRWTGALFPVAGG